MNISNLSLTYLEELYSQFVESPSSVPEDWRNYFKGVQAVTSTALNNQGRFGPSFEPFSIFNPPGGGQPVEERRNHVRHTGNGQGEELPSFPDNHAELQERVDQLVRAFRVRGHMIAMVDPLGRERPTPPELEPEFYGLSKEDLTQTFSTSTIHGPEKLTLFEILARLANTYCRFIGVQYMHIDDLQIKRWLEERMENTENHITLSPEQQIRILTRLTDAVVLEEFIQKKFLGAKSFSLEGAESLIPLLHLAIEKAGQHKVDEIVIGMAHRGRLNVLANTMGKSPRKIFREFEDADPERYMGRGDVKYHLGHSSDWVAENGHKVHLSLCFNPSHLEFINPVVLGRMRAKQDRFGDSEFRRGMAILIHGDAAFAGEGVVQETLNMSELAGYRTGGTLHIIVNNQIGFTTPPEESRSCTYSTDVARMLQIPIFHVNGEDPESVAQVIDIAMDFRTKFQRDVVVDMYCYRRRGHNESDEPSFTHPLLYREIEKRESVREGYLDHLMKLGGISRDHADRIAEERRNLLEQELAVARREPVFSRDYGEMGLWMKYKGGNDDSVEEADTKVTGNRLSHFLKKLTQLPEAFHPHPKIQRFLKQREEMARGERQIDWSAAEALAFATLATEGHRIRLSGQDCGRGTFSHRHAVLHDYENGEPYIALRHLAEHQAPVEIINSPLSEAGVLGFDYGYSLDCPDGLIMWEAQFGDFSNAAQVIIDQFISSAEDKWRRLSGIVLLLPHGFEGMGPEHSSARLERWLMLAAEDNMQICCPTTPAQYFHLLRRQIHRPLRKPLIVMSPKSLLRHPKVASGLEDLAEGTFKRVITNAPEATESVKKIVMCTGKIYYDLLAHSEELEQQQVAIIRLEQLYPFPAKILETILFEYPEQAPAVWVQEEPENMGAWPFLRLKVGERIAGRELRGICRPESASPATGSASSHKIEQRQLVEDALEV
ncbi:MAG: 2-oxoglutarate dehydrogenase E1 component [Planctomycetota bacterium]|nr:2-oxoglutarate dehydrogenase E1 component [Planctomycetota bacterium]MDA1138939.1 2-oxoglutarate dehydrogenase E1 component [Planctomycetota bacterium]